MSVQSNQPQHHNGRRRQAVDIDVVNHHSIVLFHLTTPVASAWVAEHVTDEAQFFGTALVVEPRYVTTLIRGMREAGLKVR
jgi:hypothetical protein